MSNRPGYNISDQYATYYMTFTIVGWVDIFTRKEYKDMIVDSFKYCQNSKGLILNAYVIMGSHIHLIASAEEESNGLSAIVRDFKKFTSTSIIDGILKSGRESRKEWLEVVFRYHAKNNKNNKNFQVWQQNNHPKVMLHPNFINQKINYIHNNPVVAGIVDKADEYLYSSGRNYIGRTDFILDVEVIDFGMEDGYVFT